MVGAEGCIEIGPLSTSGLCSWPSSLPPEHTPLLISDSLTLQVNLLRLVILFNVCPANKNTVKFLKTTTSRPSVCLMHHKHMSVQAVCLSHSLSLSTYFLLLILFFDSALLCTGLIGHPALFVSQLVVGASFQMF